MKKKHTTRKTAPFATFGNPGPSIGGSGTFGSLIDSLNDLDSKVTGRKHDQVEHTPFRAWGTMK